MAEQISMFDFLFTREEVERLYYQVLLEFQPAGEVMSDEECVVVLLRLGIKVVERARDMNVLRHLLDEDRLDHCDSGWN